MANKYNKNLAVQRLFQLMKRNGKHEYHNKYLYSLFRNGSFTKTSPEIMQKTIQTWRMEIDMIQVLVKWANTNKRAFKEFGPEEYKQIQDLIKIDEVNEE